MNRILVPRVRLLALCWLLNVVLDVVIDAVLDVVLDVLDVVLDILDVVPVVVLVVDQYTDVLSVYGCGEFGRNLLWRGIGGFIAASARRKKKRKDGHNRWKIKTLNTSLVAHAGVCILETRRWFQVSWHMGKTQF